MTIVLLLFEYLKIVERLTVHNYFYNTPCTVKSKVLLKITFNGLNQINVI